MPNWPKPKRASKPDYSGLQPGERRLYLVNTAGGIMPYHGVMESPDAIVDRNWETALDELASTQGARTFTGVEIHCHGFSAEVRLEPYVKMDNVENFGAALARVVQPGCLIEVLACMVSSFPIERIFHLMQYRDPTQVYTRFPLPSEIEVSKADEVALKDPAQMWLGPRWEQALDVFRPFMSSHTYRLRMNRTQTAWMRPAMPPQMSWKAMFEVGDMAEGHLFDMGKNGPRFCKLLAKSSGCIVRAAWIQQAQERGIVDGARMTDFNKYLIGDWEGFVFDYDASGLKAVNWCLKRPVASEKTWLASAVVPYTA